MEPILQPGRNCWRAPTAARAALLVDGAAYFSAFREAVSRARRCVWILGWDLDSRTKLVRKNSHDGLPRTLRAFLRHVLHQRPELHIYVLTWDFAMIYALEREWAPLYSRNGHIHRRLHFHMDGRHPVAGSQHQKVVVVDDAVAFVGGIDLTKCRWDSSAHRARDPLRVDPGGEPYAPFHDVQALVDGEAARALGELARYRWARAVGKPVPEVDDGGTTPEADPWPPSVGPQFRNIRVGIARTFPAYQGQEEVREVERLYLDTIAQARHWLYVENQYLTSAGVGDALAARLRHPEGPEVLIVLPQATSGWLERHTMDVLRARLLRRLRAADDHGRLRVCYPIVPDLEGTPLNVHAKVMVADDSLARVGSANLSNRSMGLDSECDLAFEAQGDADAGRGIAAFRNRLLAEHLDCDPQTVAETLDRTGSLIAVVEHLSHGQRRLETLDGDVAPQIDRQVPDAAVMDPERPVDGQVLVDHLVGHEERRLAGRQLLTVAGLLLILIGLAAAWRWTPLSEWLQPQRLEALGRHIAHLPVGGVLALGAYVIGTLLAIPVTLLIVTTALVYGPLLGFVYSLLGSMLGAATTYGVGRLLGRDAVRRLAGTRLNELSRRLGHRGMLTVITLRIVPVAPFTVVNMVAGVSHIGFRDFFVGSLIGIMPGILAMTLFANGLLQLLLEPTPGTLLAITALALVIAGGAWAIHRWLTATR
ncbi:MAG: VTT domain-containing protein [Gammaproteobacteria bacterium]